MVGVLLASSSQPSLCDNRSRLEEPFVFLLLPSSLPSFSSQRAAAVAAAAASCFAAGNAFVQACMHYLELCFCYLIQSSLVARPPALIFHVCRRSNLSHICLLKSSKAACASCACATSTICLWATLCAPSSSSTFGLQTTTTPATASALRQCRLTARLWTLRWRPACRRSRAAGWRYSA